MSDSEVGEGRAINFADGIGRPPSAGNGSEPWELLTAHVVNGTAIVPGIALVLEMQATIGEASLSNVVFSAMLRADANGNYNAKVASDGGRVRVIDDSGTEVASADAGAGDLEALEVPAAGGDVRAQDSIYDALDRVGNNYGQPLKVVDRLSSDGSALTATWATADSSAVEVLTAAVDGVFHALGALASYDAAFLLTNIDQIEFPLGTIVDLASNGHLVATNIIQRTDDLTADADVVDSGGQVIARLRGIRLQRFGAVSDVATVGLAATFSTDPLDQIGRFWSSELGQGVAIRPAGYGQLFQELLTGSEAFTNDTDIHVALVKVDDWMTERRSANLPEGLDTTFLPTGHEVAQLNQYETDYLYNEIFVDTVYARHNVDIGDGSTVVDVGANIGMFAMFAATRANDVRVIAVEPSPVVAPILQANLDAHVAEAHLVNAGMAEHNGSAELTFYPKSSVFSTFDPEVETERESILAIVENTVRASGNYSEEFIAEIVEEFMADRVEAVAQTCELVSLGEVIDRYGLTEIDLLKVDAEKSERGILDGIREADWPKIKQLIVEVHWEEPHGIQDVVDQLEAHGYECTTDEEDLLVGSGLYTVYAKLPGYTPAPTTIGADESKSLGALTENVDLFLSAAASHVGSTTRPTFFVACPPVDRSTEVLAEHQRMLTELAELDAVVWDANRIIADYEIGELYDPVADKLGHVPYTAEFFAALGTQIVRFLLAKSRTPRKMLVLDADDTLWKGTVGEDGVSGLTIDEPSRAVQQLAKDAISRGMVVAIASKNDEADVKAAFEKVPGMVLSWDDITAHRINWDAKSQNIRALAAELNIGSDSVVFLDDSPVQCGEVRAHAPEVLTICLEDRSSVDSGFLHHIWELDSFGEVTEEDQRRAEMYSEEAKRKELERGSSDFVDFIDQLGMTVDIEPLGEASIPRAAQMTQRTNQFNTTTVRRTEADFRALVGGGGGSTTVRVSDRFGDYGIVGLMTHSPVDGSLEVDSFMMSCRALGRGVEHQMIRTLGDEASSHGCDTVRLPFVESDRNEPVRRFLDRLAESYDVTRTEVGYELGVDTAKKIEFSPADAVSVAAAVNRSVSTVVVDSERSQRIAAELRTGAAIVTAIREQSEKERPDDTPLASPETEVQVALVDIWRTVLGYRTLGIDDNFFEFGGTSLLAVELISAIQTSDKAPDYKLVDLFDRPTIRRLTESERQAERQEESRSRGAQRRQIAGRRGRR